MQTHMDLGGGLLISVIILFFGTLAVMIARRLIDQRNPRAEWP